MLLGSIALAVAAAILPDWISRDDLTGLDTSSFKAGPFRRRLSATCFSRVAAPVSAAQRSMTACLTAARIVPRLLQCVPQTWSARRTAGRGRLAARGLAAWSYSSTRDSFRYRSDANLCVFRRGDEGDPDAIPGDYW